MIPFEHTIHGEAILGKVKRNSDEGMGNLVWDLLCEESRGYKRQQWSNVHFGAYWYLLLCCIIHDCSLYYN